MLCPVCRHPLHESVPACPGCGFELAEAQRVFGIPPQLDPVFTDLAGVMSQGDGRSLKESIRELHLRFPKISFAIIITRIPPQIPLRAWTFWIFNTGTLNSPMDKGGACRLMLLTIDADQGRAACMVGYGLEPFVNEDTLNRIIAAAQHALSAQDYAEALHAALEQADVELASISAAIPHAFGLSNEPVKEDVPGEVFAY